MSDCAHKRCGVNGHCILEALWLNPPEFSNPEPIEVAARIQERFWETRRAYRHEEAKTVDHLWDLVDMGGT